MSEQEDKEKLETLANIRARVESLQKQYNQLVSASDDSTLEKMSVTFYAREAPHQGPEDDDDDEDWEASDDEDHWNDSGCSWQSSDYNC